MPYNTEIPDDLPDYRGANVSFPPPPQRPPIHWQIAAIALAAIIVCSLLALLVFLLLGHTSPQSSGIHAGVTTIATRKTPTSPPLTAIATNDPSSTPIVSGATPGAGASPGTSSGSSPVAASPTMPPTSTPTVIDDTQWSYTGAWGVRDPAICDGSCTISRTQGSTAQLAFTGRQISVIGIHCPRCGIVGITVSGINSSVDTYRSQRQDSAIYTSPVLPYGTYTLVATVTGTANPLATNIAIGIDYALIFA